MVCFAKALEMDDFPLTQETDHIVDVRIVGQAEDVVIGKTGFLFWCDLVRTTFSVFGRIQAVRDAVDLVLQVFQGFLEAPPVHIAVAGG